VKCNIHEDQNPQQHRCGSLKSYVRLLSVLYCRLGRCKFCFMIFCRILQNWFVKLIAKR